MARLLQWPDVLLEAIYCGASQQEISAARKLLVNEPLQMTDVHHLIGLVGLCPISRLDLLEMQEFEEYLMTRVTQEKAEAL